ncbi:hypothetical protein SAMN02745148_00916 [Modicisalibacter ilicicola DSM 19980]|uniref:Uncharacterized protein n=1 Tax=Modicisalibacter ilicicola DSM 19980 TaxID=1121942 RepID=A0A1M4VPC4_9GAMM|nr:hypothetical protein [Halomonas ilicicola]SHE70690.1 hypothetical protein SAMN02745148_00916 [Halomonas ilicicola DSM 19980]
MSLDLYAYIWGALFVLIFSNIAVCLYVAFFKLSLIESHLANCKLVENNRDIWRGGLFGRMYRLGQISGMIFFPSPIVKNGEADLEEIQRLPAELKRWVKIPYATMALLSIAMLVLWAWGKQAGWLK